MDQPKVIWTTPAETDLYKIIDFLEESRSAEVAIRFVESIYHSIDVIANPEAVYLLRIIDTRSNPADNPF